MLEAFKFQIVPVLINRDEATGKVSGEVQAEPVIVYGLDGVAGFVEKFPAELETLNADRKPPRMATSVKRKPARKR